MGSVESAFIGIFIYWVKLAEEPLKSKAGLTAALGGHTQQHYPGVLHVGQGCLVAL